MCGSRSEAIVSVAIDLLVAWRQRGRRVQYMIPATGGVTTVWSTLQASVWVGTAKAFGRDWECALALTYHRVNARRHPREVREVGHAGDRLEVWQESTNTQAPLWSFVKWLPMLCVPQWQKSWIVLRTFFT